MRAKWRTVAVRSAAGPTMKPGVSQRNSSGQREGVAQLQEAGGLVGAVGVDRAAEVGGFVGDHAQRAPVDARERGDDAGAEAAAQLEHGALVEQGLDDRADVVDALALLGDERRAGGSGRPDRGAGSAAAAK